MCARITILFYLTVGAVASAQDGAAATNRPLPMVPATNTPARAASPTNLTLRVIRAELLHKMLQRTNDFVLVDVMPRLYYQDYHIKGAMSVPEAELDATVREWPRNRRIVLYCQDADCEIGRDAAISLMTMGFTDVLLYEGGKREWHAKQYEAVGRGKLLD